MDTLDQHIGGDDVHAISVDAVHGGIVRNAGEQLLAGWFPKDPAHGIDESELTVLPKGR